MDLKVGDWVNFKIGETEYPFICREIRKRWTETTANFTSYDPPSRSIVLDKMIEEFKSGDVIVIEVECAWFQRVTKKRKYLHRYVYSKWWVRRRDGYR